ncbi:MAG: hypothetical protein AB8B91_09015 [Rubripirellula sp.]
MKLLKSIAPFCVLFSLLAAPGTKVDAATFCVTSKIFEGASLDAAAEHLVLFDEGLVYDLPQIDSRFVTVYDPAQGRVTLLDRQNQTQATVSTKDLLQVSAQARAAAKTPDQQSKLGLNATVQPSTRMIGHSIKFANVEYHASTQTPAEPSMALDYGRFADLAARLNIVRRLGPPPFARMTLYGHIAKQGEVPLATTLTIHRGGTEEDFRSTHEITALSSKDRGRIDEVRGMLTLYQEVALKQIR